VGIIFSLIYGGIVIKLAGFSLPSFPLLIVVAVASLIDEVGHDRFASGGVLIWFFRFRIVLKVVVVFLTVLSWVDMVNSLGFFCFDLSYDVMDVVLLRMKKGK